MFNSESFTSFASDLAIADVIIINNVSYEILEAEKSDIVDGLIEVLCIDDQDRESWFSFEDNDEIEIA